MLRWTTGLCYLSTRNISAGLWTIGYMRKQGKPWKLWKLWHRGTCYISQLRWLQQVWRGLGFCTRRAMDVTVKVLCIFQEIERQLGFSR
jgi:hypothetical protein